MTRQRHRLAAVARPPDAVFQHILLARSDPAGEGLAGGCGGDLLDRRSALLGELFALGADLAVPEREGKAERLRVVASQVERLERDIDTLNAELAPLTSFILPGGVAAAAYLHLARTVCRRAERMIVELAAQPDEKVSPAVIHYMNRLSDFLFVAARAVNGNGAGDVLWVPGQNR